MDAPLREAVNDVSNGKSLDENADKNREFYFGQLLLAVDVYSGRHHHSRLCGAVPHSDKSDSPGWRRRYSRFFFRFSPCVASRGAALPYNGGRKPAVIYLCGFWISNDAAERCGNRLFFRRLHFGVCLDGYRLLSCTGLVSL